MKKILFFTLFVLGMGYYSCQAQTIPVYPIPSYGVTVNGYADFREGYNTNGPSVILERRGVSVTIKTGSPGNRATIWIYSLDQETIYGPFTVGENEPVSQAIDDRQWGVFMMSEEEVIVDVWIVDN